MFPRPCIRLDWFLSCGPLLSALVRHGVRLMLRAHPAPSFCSERFGIALHRFMGITWSTTVSEARPSCSLLTPAPASCRKYKSMRHDDRRAASRRPGPIARRTGGTACPPQPGAPILQGVAC